MNKNDIEQIIRKEIVETVMKTQDFLIIGNWKMQKTKQEDTGSALQKQSDLFLF